MRTTSPRPPGPTAVRIGAHLNGGIKGALDHARRIGLGRNGHPDDPGGDGGPIQVWSRNPSAWRSSAPAGRDVERFREGCADLDIGPVFVHGIYLMNVASPDDGLWERSIDALADQLTVGALLGAAAVILHPGAGGGQPLEVALDRCAMALRRAL